MPQLYRVLSRATEHRGDQARVGKKLEGRKVM